ncbi:MAG TPA: 2-dehydropantoate 2-reductase [Pyrinomonadaceae bacterium]|nr:2-dehydropantoate 2-reductase [Pyrinomonadaceae bacterium]
MKFAVIGAGAIGAFVGAMLAKAGEEVILIARGPHLEAMRECGVRVRSSQGEFVANPQVTADPREAGEVDVVLLTLKAHSIPGMAESLNPLLGAETAVVSAQNGIPWWYFYRHGGELDGLQLESVDPGGVIAASIEARRIVGCVIYCSAIISEPGVIDHLEGTRFSIGEPDGSRSERCRLIAEAFIRAGLRCPIRNSIRNDIWVKLLGSVAFNPISALTRATLEEIIANLNTREVSQAIMLEVGELARRLGIDVGITIEQRLAGAAKVGAHKTSMLQDLEAGRPLELEAIVGAVIELADRLDLSIPHTRTVYACTKLLGEKSLNVKQ